MPFQNEHACRIAPPGAFQEGSFRRISQGKLDIIIGRKKGTTKTSTQAFRYPKKDWTEEAARNHCKRNEGSFEPAKKEQTEEQNEFTYVSKVLLAENSNTSKVEVLRVGTIQDRGLRITKKMLENFVANFKEGVVGQFDEVGNPELPVNMQHKTGDEAVGWIKNLFVEGKRLLAEVEWTELGAEKITKKLFKFVSAEFFGEYPHHETGKGIKNVFTGLALTNTPAIKAQAPLTLSEDLHKQLIIKSMFEKMLNSLKEREYVSKDDKELLRSCLEELPEEEKAEHEEGVKEVEAKPEEEPKSEEEEKKDEEEAKEKEELEAKAKKAETLEEKLEEETKARQELQAKVERNELNEMVSSKLLISKDGGRSVGLSSDDEKEEAVNFLMSLDGEQKDEFFKLFTKIKHVDLNTYGDSGTDTNVSLTEEKQKEEDKKEAEEMSKETGKELHECLAEIYEKRENA